MSEIYERAERLFYQGRLDEAVARLATPSSPTDDITPVEQTRRWLLQGRILTTGIFYAKSTAEAALSVIQQAQALATSLNQPILVGEALCLLGQATYYGTLNRGESDWDTPRALFEQAIQVGQSVGDRRGQAEALFFKGLMLERQQRFDDAYQTYQAAEALADQGGHGVEKSFIVRHKAGIHQRRQEYDAALRLYRESLSLREATGFTVGIPFAHLAVGDVLSDQGDLTGALAHYEAALAIAEEIKLDAASAFALLSIGDIYVAQDKTTTARPYFERAAALAQTLHIARLTKAASNRLKGG